MTSRPLPPRSKMQTARPNNPSQTNGHAVLANGKSVEDWQPPSMIRAEVKLGIDDNVPPEYIEDLAQRLSLHQRLSWSNSEDEIQELRNELRDRYGPIPDGVEVMLETARLRLLAEQADVASLRANGERARLLLNAPVGGAKAQLQRLLGPNARIGNTQIVIQLDKGLESAEYIEEIAAVIETIRNFKQRVMALLNA